NSAAGANHQLLVASSAIDESETRAEIIPIRARHRIAVFAERSIRIAAGDIESSGKWWEVLVAKPHVQLQPVAQAEFVLDKKAEGGIGQRFQPAEDHPHSIRVIGEKVIEAVVEMKRGVVLVPLGIDSAIFEAGLDRVTALDQSKIVCHGVGL